MNKCWEKKVKIKGRRRRMKAGGDEGDEEEKLQLMKESRRDEEGHVLTRPRTDGRRRQTSQDMQQKSDFRYIFHQRSSNTPPAPRPFRRKKKMPEKCLSPEVGSDDRDASQSSTTISSQHRTV